MRVCLVSLGCDKNLVDSEFMLGLLRDAGYEFTFAAEQEFYLFLLDENGRPTSVPSDESR